MSNNNGSNGSSSSSFGGNGTSGRATLPENSKIKAGNSNNPTEGVGSFGVSEATPQERGETESLRSSELENKEELGKESLPQESLPKEGLPKEGLSKEEPQNAPKEESPKSGGSPAGGMLSQILGGTLSLKTKLILIGWGAGAFVGLMGILFLLSAFYSPIAAWASLFGAGTEEIIKKEYDEMDTDKVTAALAGDKDLCDLSFLDMLGELFANIFGDESFADSCAVIRYINETSRKKEELYFGIKDDTKVIDRGLILSTVIYGYSSQPDQFWYTKDCEAGKLSEEECDRIQVDEPMQILDNIVRGFVDENGNKIALLKKTDIDAIINSLIHEEIYPWFTLEYDEETDTYSCEQSDNIAYYYDEEKYKIFLRYGYKVEDGNFDAAGYITNGVKVLENNQNPSSVNLYSYRGEGYIYDSNMLKAWDSTDVECKVPGAAPSNSDGSVATAVRFFTSRGMTSEPGLDPIQYTQYLDLNGPEAKLTDDEKDFGVPCLTNDGYKTCILKYKNGFAYYKFPSFKISFDRNAGEVYAYDKIFTYNHIESLISVTIIDHRTTLNDLMGYTYVQPKVHIPNGDGVVGEEIFENDSINQYCGDYIDASLDEISVNVVDCASNSIERVAFKDYIMGVTYAEIGAYVPSNGDDYYITQMIAAINYALTRKGNDKRGTELIMKSGSCDQNWCDLTRGCHRKLVSGTHNESTFPTGKQPSGSYHYKTPATEETKSAFSSFYNTASRHLVISSTTGKIRNTGYTASVQNKWRAQSKEGKEYAEIIEEHYGNVDVIDCMSMPDSPYYNIEEKYETTVNVAPPNATEAELGRLIAAKAREVYTTLNSEFCYVSPSADSGYRYKTYNDIKSYRYNDKTYFATDCNGFVSYVIHHAIGIGPTTATNSLSDFTFTGPGDSSWYPRSQYGSCMRTVATGLSLDQALSSASVGDLIASNGDGSTHIQIYIGDGKVIDNGNLHLNKCGNVLAIRSKTGAGADNRINHGGGRFTIIRVTGTGC